MNNSHQYGEGSTRARLNPCELEIDLFCKGLRIASEAESRVRLARRTRAGLGSGLELILPGTFKDVWVNAPVSEPFAAESPYRLRWLGGGFAIEDEADGHVYPARVAPSPKWYERKTSRGVRMSQVGTLQGTYLGIYVGPVCRYWVAEPSCNCKFCTTGLNVGANEIAAKRVSDVVEACLRARQESGVTFVHFNSGYQEQREFRMILPFLKAVKKATGLMVGLQLAPSLDLSVYDELIGEGADHFSFCFEFMSQEAFRSICPGKEKTLGREAFFKAMDYTASKLGKGRVSGEIIAGVEPLKDTRRAIDRITGCGAFPTVCVFRPLSGSAMEGHPPPSYADMREVFQYMIESCIRERIPIGIAPNIEVSLVVQPTDALYLAPGGPRSWAYRLYNRSLARIMAPYFKRRLNKGATTPP